MYVHLCLSKFLDSTVCHLRVQACITEKRLPILSKLFLPFFAYSHQKKVWETATMHFTQSRFQAPNGKDATLDSG